MSAAAATVQNVDSVRPLSPPPLRQAVHVDPFRAWLDDLALDVAPIHDLAFVMLTAHARDGRERAILTARFGLDGQEPATLQQIGDAYSISRERVRQLLDKSVLRLAGRVLKSEQDNDFHRIFAQRYDPAEDREALLRRLTLEACAADTGALTKLFVVLKLRVAGHRADAVNQNANDVRDRTLRVKARLVELEARAHSADRYATAHLQRWLDCVQWPADTTASADPIPMRPLRSIDIREDGRGATFFDKLDREAMWDSQFEERLLRTLNNSKLVTAFQEQPVRIPYRHNGTTRPYYPDVVAQLHDGRAVLIEAKPVYELAYAVNQDKFAAARDYAHSRGWGWLVWTANVRFSIPELTSRRVDPALRQRLTAAVTSGGIDWPALQRFNNEGLEFLDLLTLTISNSWRWERHPFRLTTAEAGTASAPASTSHH